MPYRFKPTSKTKEPENADKAYEYAIFLLSLRLRTVGEVILKMQGRGYTEKIIEQVIERLKDQKYLNDQQYAEIFLENLKAYRNFGFYGIKKKFMEKKLPPATIEEILENGLPIAEEEKIARRFLKQQRYEVKSADAEDAAAPHYRTFGDTVENKEKAKMANRLKSRGFRGEVIAKLLF